MQVGQLVRFPPKPDGPKWIVDTGLILDVASDEGVLVYWVKRDVVCEQRKVYLEVISE